MAEITTNIDLIAEALRQGKLAAIPTETVYGLAGNALDVNAVAAIFEAKQRPSFDPLIMHLASAEAVSDYVTDFPAPLRALADAIWPGPLTLLLPRRALVPDLVTSGLERVAVRVPGHPLALGLLQSLDFPLAAPSANPFGYISPTLAEHVQAQLGDRIPLILDGGACSVGIESTIVGMEEGMGDSEPCVYRLGGLSVSEIENIIGPVTVKAHSSSQPAAPGSLEQHYAPGTAFLLDDTGTLAERLQQQGKYIAALRFQAALPAIDATAQRVLSLKGDLREAAARLFAAMRELDALGADTIVAEPLPEEGLGLAINDRLRRAAAQRTDC